MKGDIPQTNDLIDVGQDCLLLDPSSSQQPSSQPISDYKPYAPAGSVAQPSQPPFSYGGASGPSSISKPPFTYSNVNSTPAAGMPTPGLSVGASATSNVGTSPRQDKSPLGGGNNPVMYDGDHPYEEVDDFGPAAHTVGAGGVEGMGSQPGNTNVAPPHHSGAVGGAPNVAGGFGVACYRNPLAGGVPVLPAVVC